MGLKGKKPNISASGKTLLPKLILLMRLVLTVIVLLVVYNITVSTVAFVVILALALVMCGFDIGLNAVRAVLKKKFFEPEIFVCIAAVVCFAVGCFKEAIIFVIIYQLCIEALDYAVSMTRRAAIKLLPDKSEESNNLRYAIAHYDEQANSIKNKISEYYDIFFKAAAAFSVLYMIALPLFTDMTFVMSVRRGAMVLMAVAPCSMFVSLSLAAVYGMSYTANYGVFVQNSHAFENAANVKAVVFDKSNVIAATPKISAVISPVLKNEMFLRLAAYVAYRSEQSIAPAIVKLYNGAIENEYISSFSDIYGMGMEAVIGGKPVLLGSKTLLDTRGITLTEEQTRRGNVLYLVIENRYAGAIIFSENINPYAEKTVSDLAEQGIASILVSDDSAEATERSAKAIKLTDFYVCDETLKKAAKLKEIKQSLNEKNTLMYVSAEALEYHTDADIDVKVGTKTDVDDVRTSNIGIFGLPVLISTAKKVKTLSIATLAISILIKLLLVILSLSGYTTLWFVVLVEYALSMFGILAIGSIQSKTK